MSDPVVGIHANGLLVLRDRLVDLPALAVHVSEVAVCRSISRIELDGARELRGRVVPSLLVDIGEAELAAGHR